MALSPMEQKLMGLIEPSVSALGYECLGVEYRGQGQSSRLRIFIDKPDGITVDDCEAVSRQVSGILDVEDPIHGHYALEVSSPGLDRPLFSMEHFQRFTGHEVKFRLRVPRAGQRNFKGTIVRIDGQTILLTAEDGTELKVLFTEVEKANLVPKFD